MKFVSLITVALLAVVLLVILILSVLFELEYRKTVKHANDSERERKKQGKTVEEWYVAETKFRY